MATTNITMRIDEQLKSQLQALLSDLGLDLTTFFTLAAKQAVREQALPFLPRKIYSSYNERAYQLAMSNTKYNSSGRAVVEQKDEWRDEAEWEEMFQKMKKEKEG